MPMIDILADGSYEPSPFFIRDGAAIDCISFDPCRGLLAVKGRLGEDDIERYWMGRYL